MPRRSSPWGRYQVPRIGRLNRLAAIGPGDDKIGEGTPAQIQADTGVGKAYLGGG